MTFNLLFITKDFSKYVERNTSYLIDELKKHINLTVWTSNGSIEEILNKIPNKPDFILLNDLKDSRCPLITNLDKIKIPFGMIFHDIHWKVKKRKDFLTKNNVKYVFTIYRDAFNDRFNDYKNKVIWLPHYINPEIFKDYHLNKDIDYLFMGRLDWYYPLRIKIYNKMKDINGFITHSHPGYRNINENEEKVLVGSDYAKEINRAKIFLTCNSIYKYPLIKYYEVLACKTLLLAPTSNELEDLGFIPGTHFVNINSNNFYDKAKYYLEHEDERLEIAENGYKMVHEKHTVNIRATQLINEIKLIIAK